MKKILILVAALLFAAQFTKAQTEKGTQNLGAYVSYQGDTGNQLSVDPYDNSATSENTKNTTFTFGPSYSYFIKNNLELGTTLYYSYLNDNLGVNSNPSNEWQHTYQGTLFVRRYFMCTTKLGFRVGAYGGYERENSQYTYPPANAIDDETSRTNAYFGGVDLGLVYYPAKHLELAATLADLQYSHYKGNNGSLGNESGNNVDLSFITSDLGLSIFYVFGGK